jgi:hypothetical protein
MSNRNSRESRERENEKRRQKRVEQKQGDNYKRDAKGEVVYNAQISDKPKKVWKNEKTKSRAWAFVAYPESAPENWQDILQRTGLEFAISPLHDSDKDPTEEDKKTHWHIIMVWRSGTATGTSARRISDSVNAVLPIPLNAVRGYYRYLTHKDNPDKYQYDEGDIQLLNGFNIANYSELSSSEVEIILDQLQRLIRANGLVEYSDLIEMLEDNGMITEMRIARKHTIFFTGYLRSRRHKFERLGVDQITGEVVK